jgi:hypothetical protein
MTGSYLQAAGGINPSDVWEMEDERLLKAARQLIERNRDRVTNASSAGFG